MFHESLLDESGTVFIDDRDPGRERKLSYLFHDPVDTIIARSVNEVADALARLDESLRMGKYAAGYIAYEAGFALDKPMRSRHPLSSPVIWLGVYSKCSVFDADDVHIGNGGSVADIRNVQFNIDEREYLDGVERVKEYIRDGDVYQINYTCKLRFQNKGSTRSLFARLRDAHPVPYSAFVNTGEEHVISLSPELFLRREGREVIARPMKGTAKRGRWYEDDEMVARRLSGDEKNCAENVMIVDLMRNDLGRVCEIGSIQVTELFHVERYRSLFQMTSSVAGHLRENTSASELLRAAFPPGSITGAPKIRAVEIIDELEHEARGVYCGCIGMFRPNGDCLLNVAIRTIAQRGQECEMGLGSGIVADSEPHAEWTETRLKGRFLTAVQPKFHLLETMRLNVDGQFVLLEEHIERMRKSAVYFSWSFPEEQLRDTLHKAASKTTEESRVRLLLAADGTCKAEISELKTRAGEAVRVALSSRKTDPSDTFLYHKTTRREDYDADWREAREQGYFDLIYLNVDGEITEGAVTNMIMEIGGRWYTAPLRCGLLPGIWRARKLEQDGVEERVLGLDDLELATRIVLGNSVRGSVEVGLIEQTGSPDPLWSRPTPSTTRQEFSSGKRD